MNVTEFGNILDESEERHPKVPNPRERPAAA
jgi:hypothetical protein